MKFRVKIILLFSMLFIGVICGIAFYILTGPLASDSIIHCILMGLLFGIINYIISYNIFKKYYMLKIYSETLKKDLKIDKLTGLLNRWAFDDDVENISDNNVSIIFIDIDNFRTFNNNFGHQAGDIILKKVSQTILSCVGSIGMVYRYGGEEIVVLLGDCPKNEAFNIAEKIRTTINNLNNAPYHKLTVSLGVSSYPDDGADINEVIKACDDALLSAKKLGKNRTYSG